VLSHRRPFPRLWYSIERQSFFEHSAHETVRANHFLLVLDEFLGKELWEIGSRTRQLPSGKPVHIFQ
jgi:hypothetical protein